MKFEVKQVSKDEANTIIEKREPLGLFYLSDGNVYVGIDNREREAWVEEFISLEDCMNWLNEFDGMNERGKNQHPAPEVTRAERKI